MKPIFKQILKCYLKYITKLALFMHQPKIIVVAGSINKAFAKGIIKKTLQEADFSVRANPKNFNTEIGLPLAILDLSSGYNSFRAWWPVIAVAPRAIFQKMPQFLVLSLGTSDPGDMKYLLTIIRRPETVVITDITQRYIEGFRDMENIQKEYQALVQKIPTSGLLIYNNDNLRLRSLKKDFSGTSISFGFDDTADYQILKTETNNEGQLFRYRNNQDVLLKKRINRFGRHHLYNQLIAEIIKDYVIPAQKK